MGLEKGDKGFRPCSRHEIQSYIFIYAFFFFSSLPPPSRLRPVDNASISALWLTLTLSLGFTARRPNTAAGRERIKLRRERRSERSRRAAKRSPIDDRNSKQQTSSTFPRRSRRGAELSGVKVTVLMRLITTELFRRSKKKRKSQVHRTVSDTFPSRRPWRG